MGSLFDTICRLPSWVHQCIELTFYIVFPTSMKIEIAHVINSFCSSQSPYCIHLWSLQMNTHDFLSYSHCFWFDSTSSPARQQLEASDECEHKILLKSPRPRRLFYDNKEVWSHVCDHAHRHSLRARLGADMKRFFSNLRNGCHRVCLYKMIN
jgi:uncharacterized C2H2 Zn-finger protein